MISGMSKMAIRFMKCISYWIHFITKDVEIDNFYYCAALYVIHELKFFNIIEWYTTIYGGKALRHFYFYDHEWLSMRNTLGFQLGNSCLQFPSWTLLEINHWASSWHLVLLSAVGQGMEKEKKKWVMLVTLYEDRFVCLQQKWALK